MSTLSAYVIDNLALYLRSLHVGASLLTPTLTFIMTAVVDQEASQDIELDAARIDDYEEIDVSSLSEDSDDERSRSKTTKNVSARDSSSIV